jgi:hypothetical protein
MCSADWTWLTPKDFWGSLHIEVLWVTYAHKADRRRIVACEPCNDRRLGLLCVVLPFARPRWGNLERCGLTCEDAEAKDQGAMRNIGSGERRTMFYGSGEKTLLGKSLQAEMCIRLRRKCWRNIGGTARFDGASISV